MKTSRSFTLILLSILALACGAGAQTSSTSSQPALSSQGTEPLILDLNRFQKDKFVTGGKTKARWQTLAGRRVFDGIQFQIEGHGCVYGEKAGGKHPDFIGIQVGRKFDELHLLHAAQWPDIEGRQIALIRLNYADGTTHEFPIFFGGQVRDWQRLPSEEKELLSDPNTKVVWRAPGSTRTKSTLRLFKTVLENPYPQKEVTTLDVVSSRHLAAYDLYAATVANHQPGRAVTPPVPAEGPEGHFEGTLTVRVTDRATGQPLAGALLDPRMTVDKVSPIASPVYTSATGEGLIRYPVGRATRIRVSVKKEGYSSQSAIAELGADEPTNRLGVELPLTPKLSGVVSNAAGAPLDGVKLTLWPPWRVRSKGATTDANGRYALSWERQNQDESGNQVFLIAQDLKRNLATAQEIDEGMTNLDLSLEPGLALAGRASDTNGKALTNAEANIMFWTENMGSTFGKPLRADTQGRFELRALPPGRHYGVSVSAKGYGQKSCDLRAEETDKARVELDPFELPLANLRIAGVVLDADDKPVTNANIHAYGEGQPSVNGRSDAKGHFSFDHVCDGTIGLTAWAPNGGGYANITAEGGDTNITLQLGVSQSFVSSARASKVTGTVTGPDGKPAPKVRVKLFPNPQGEKKTDAQGRFTLMSNPNYFGGGTVQRVAVAWDPARNLAAALDLEEEATNANLRLAPALTLAGRVTDAGGKALSNAQVSVIFWTERSGEPLGAPTHTDAAGRFEFKGLPPGRRYTVNASAKGFGQENRNLEAAETEGHRVELEPLELAVADQRIAGVVLDDNDKPVARAMLFTYGDKQPNLRGQADAQGRFTFDKVCAGPIQISANSRGGYGNVTAAGGDTNITIQVGGSPGLRRAAPREAHLKGKPLPDLAPVGLAAADCPAGQPLLAVLIDAEQRPSRHALSLLGKKAATLKQKGLAVVVIQAGDMASEVFEAWKKEAALPFPAGRFKTHFEQARATWGAAALPWLILTDKTHRVAAEGFEVDELEARLQSLEE